MRILFLLMILLILQSENLVGQEYWRAVTLSAVSGTDFKRDKFNMVTAALHYDLRNRFYISNWTGMQFNYTPQRTSWFSTQTTINRYISKWNFGVGVQYGMVGIPNMPYLSNNSTFFITTASYRFKLR